MFKEYRNAPSTPQHWAANFSSRPGWQDRLAVARLHVGLDSRWREMRTRLTAGSIVLDAGCGRGQWPAFLRHKGYRVIGADFSKPLLDFMRRRHPEIPLVNASIQDLPLAEESVDAVISWGVIEHDETGPGPALREFRRVLRPGGRLFVTVPLDSEPNRRASVILTGAPTEGKVFYQYLFESQDLTEALAAAGFEVEQVVPCSRFVGVALPRVYRLASRGPGLLRDGITQLLKPYAWMRRKSAHMLLGVGVRS